jgi:hypothetical protein
VKKTFPPNKIRMISEPDWKETLTWTRSDGYTLTASVPRTDWQVWVNPSTGHSSVRNRGFGGTTDFGSLAEALAHLGWEELS